MKSGLGAIVGMVAALSWPGSGAHADTPPAAPLTTPVAAPAPEGATPESETPESLKLAQDPSLRLTLQVKINGQGPFDFLVDTGSDRTVISRELAASLALPPAPNVLIHETVAAGQANTLV